MYRSSNAKNNDNNNNNDDDNNNNSNDKNYNSLVPVTVSPVRSSTLYSEYVHSWYQKNCYLTRSVPSMKETDLKFIGQGALLSPGNDVFIP